MAGLVMPKIVSRRIARPRRDVVGRDALVLDGMNCRARRASVGRLRSGAEIVAELATLAGSRRIVAEEPRLIVAVEPRRIVAVEFD